MTDTTDKRTDDELLSAYIDGELAEHEADVLSARLAEDPSLMQRFEALRATDDAVREVYKAIDATPMPAAVLGLFESPQPKAKADNVVAFPARFIERFFEAPVAIAASVALMAGFLGATLLRQDVSPTGASDALVAGPVANDTALHGLLESTPSGELRDVAGGAGEVLLTFEDRNGDWCRQLRVSQAERSLHGVACRRGAAWQLETIAIGDAGTPEGQLGTAAGAVPEAVDAAVDALIGPGVSIEPENENAIISTGWKKFSD